VTATQPLLAQVAPRMAPQRVAAQTMR